MILWYFRGENSEIQWYWPPLVGALGVRLKSVIGYRREIEECLEVYALHRAHLCHRSVDKAESHPAKKEAPDHTSTTAVEKSYNRHTINHKSSLSASYPIIYFM